MKAFSNRFQEVPTGSKHSGCILLPVLVGDTVCSLAVGVIAQ